MEATYRKHHGEDVYWEVCDDPDEIITEPQGINFLSLPLPDRKWTNAFDERYQLYGNYKYIPATHMQVADGCWHGKCSFCVENKKKYLIRPVDSVMAEIEDCIDLGFKEIFDDSGTFPDDQWLFKFCYRKIVKGYDIPMGCNMRIDGKCDFSLMKQAGFRMVLFGVESANQKTLDRINKNVNVGSIIPTIEKASKVGLQPHIAVMFGYPWENEADENNTLNLVHYLLKKGYAKTAQASLYSVPNEEAIDRGNVKRIYDVAKYPEFWFNKIISLKNIYDLRYLIKSIKKGIVRD